MSEDGKSSTTDKSIADRERRDKETKGRKKERKKESEKKRCHEINEELLWNVDLLLLLVFFENGGA
jgi:hypothetical protein